MEQISWTPRAYVFKNFLSNAECDHLIDNVRFLINFESVKYSLIDGSYDIHRIVVLWRLREVAFLHRSYPAFMA